MIVEKYILYFDRANAFVSKRHGHDPLTHTELKIMYLCKRGKGSSISHSKFFGGGNYAHSLRDLVALGYIVRTVKGFYDITDAGRVFLSQVRKYLVNIRM